MKSTVDILLLCTNHRIHSYYLNIIKALPEATVGVMDAADKKHTKSLLKIAETDRLFIDCCRRLGAQILDPARPCACRLLLAPQDAWEGLAKLQIDSKTKVVLHRFASGSLGLDSFKSFGFERIWVYETKLFLGMLENEKRQDLTGIFDITEMGTPYARYPAFDFSEMNISYLIAYPTPMLISDYQTKMVLLEDMKKVVYSIEEDKLICLKLHNVLDGGFVLCRNSVLKDLWMSLLEWLDRPSQIFSLISVFWEWNAYLHRKTCNFRTMILDSLLGKKSVFLSDLTPYYNFNIEHFLPFVKEGVITGISACIWHALYNRIPVYNCDRQQLYEKMPNFGSYKNFLVPSCQGKLVFDPVYFGNISQSARQADLIALIRTVL